MPDDLKAILARVEEELGEDARAALAEALGLDGDRADRSGSDLPDDVDEAMAGEMKAGGDGEETASPDDPITEAELEERLEEIRDEALTQDELAEAVDDLEESAKEALMDALPGLAEQVGQKMARGGVDYTGAIGEAFGSGQTATGLERGRTPTGSGRGTRQKMDAGGSESEGVDYTEEIAAAFGAGE
jgi:hypothetical protein